MASICWVVTDGFGSLMKAFSSVERAYAFMNQWFDDLIDEIDDTEDLTVEDVENWRLALAAQYEAYGKRNQPFGSGGIAAHPLPFDLGGE